MATQLDDRGTYSVVSTIATVGREKRRPRGHVYIEKDDPEAIRAEVIRQVEAAHAKVGITPK